jgi:peptidoglycan hydrolase FlgJ
MSLTLPPTDPQPRPAAPDQTARLRAAAAGMETAFLAEMLRNAGLGQTPGLTGGGVGEDQFASMLVEEQARAMVEAGGIGLTESLFAALAGRVGGTE